MGISCVLCVTSFRLLSPTDERHTMKIFANPWNDYLLFADGCMDLMVFSCLLKNIIFFLVWGFLRVLSFTGHQTTHHTKRSWSLAASWLDRAEQILFKLCWTNLFHPTSSIHQCPSVHYLQRIIITALSMKHNSKAPFWWIQKENLEWFTLLSIQTLAEWA